MTELSAEKLADLREIAGEAIPGPWVLANGGVFYTSMVGLQPLTLPGSASKYIAAFDPETVLAMLDLIADQQAELAKVREWEAEKQYRAIIGRPWSFLDRNAPKGVPIFEATGPKNERVVHLQRPEETLEWVERWEERDVRLGPWLPAGGESND